MFNAGHGGFVLLFVEIFAGNADMLDEKAKRNLLCHLDCPLDLIHGLYALGPIAGRDIDRRPTCAAGLVVSVLGRVEGKQLRSAVAEPVADLTHMLLAVGVVEVVPRGMNFDGLRAASHKLVQQARVQPLFNKRIGGNTTQHQQPTAWPRREPRASSLGLIFMAWIEVGIPAGLGGIPQKTRLTPPTLEASLARAGESNPQGQQRFLVYACSRASPSATLTSSFRLPR